MSVLTKIFVVSLVVLSLLLSAATITFVNSIDDYKRASTAQQAQIAALTAQLGIAKSDAQAATASSQAATAQLDAAKTKAENATAELAKAVNDLQAQLTLARGDKTIAQADVAKLTAAVNASESTKALFAQQVTELRDSLAKLQTQVGDLNVAFSDATNKLNITEEQRRVLAEQLTEARTQIDKVSGALRDRGVDPNNITGSGLAAGAPAINGVVRGVRNIGGIPHASISVGSDDAVKVGMEFNILDRTNGQFLGKLKVVAVEPNEAVGRITGPNPTAVAAGAEVRTQL